MTLIAQRPHSSDNNVTTNILQALTHRSPELIVTFLRRLTCTRIEVSYVEIGHVFEDLIRRFNDASNEEAVDHCTPERWSTF